MLSLILSFLLTTSNSLISILGWLFLAVIALLIVWMLLSLLRPQYEKFANILFVIAVLIALILLVGKFWPGPQR